MKSYAIENQKGGVGKTSVTLALASELARGGAAVLVVDLDPQASATKVLGVDVDERPTVADVMLEPNRFALGDVASEPTGVHACAGRDGACVAGVTTGNGRRVHPASASSGAGRRRHRPHCPPSLGMLTINALAAASRLIVVTEPSFLALQGISELLDTYELVRQHHDEGLEPAGVIVNRWERTVEHRRSVAEIERYFGDGLAWQPYLTKRTALQDAAGHGLPVHRLGNAAGREITRAVATLANRLVRPNAIR